MLNKIRPVRIYEALSISAFYLFFSLLYHVVLWYNIGGYKEGGLWSWMDLEDYWFSAGWQYLFFFFASVLIWYLGVFLWRKRTYVWQISVVALLVPLFVYLVRFLRYFIIDEMGGISRLREEGEVWDLYIPYLFLMIQFGYFFAYQYYRENQQKILVEGQLRQAALKSELSAIKAQLNPHFLYNTFNTINAAIDKNNEVARNMVGELSDLFRYQLRASFADVVPLEEELAFVEKYLRLEKYRLEDRLSFSINAPLHLRQRKVPPMILQPLVENSIKHGIAPLIEGGDILVQVEEKGDALFFVVKDTGVGIEDVSQIFDQGVGLKNTKIRLEKMYGSTLNLEKVQPHGVLISFVI